MESRSESRSLRDWLHPPDRRAWLLRALCLITVAAMFSFVRRPGDFHGYLLVGDTVLVGGDIYRDVPPGISTWPPAFSLFCVPLALLADVSIYLARGLWLLVNVVSLIVVLRLTVRLVHGKNPSLRAAPSGDIRIVDPEVLVPLLLAGRYVISNFSHLQINIPLFALTLGGLYLQRVDRSVGGGIALGTAAALKVMPILFLPYLLYRRRWRAAAWMALTVAVISLSPALVYGISGLLDYYATWRETVAAGWTVGKMNQSVLAMLERFIGHGMLPFTVGGIVEVTPTGATLVKVAWWSIVVAIGGLCLWVFRRPVSQDSEAAVAEWSVVFIVAALFAPVCWKAYLVVLLLPFSLLFALAVRSHGRTRSVAKWTMISSFALGALTSSGLVGKPIAGVLEMSSVVTVSALVVLFGSIWMRSVLPTCADDSPGGGQLDG